VLFEQFRFFFNLYFLLVALTQFIPRLKVGFMFTYIAPLVFVLSVTMIKEAIDDLQRYKRDQEANSQIYNVFIHPSERPDSSEYKSIPSSDIKVSDIVLLSAGQRVPADMILLRTKDESGSIFIKTDQIDGETDWKVRKAVNYFQKAESDELIWEIEGNFNIECPRKEIYEFAANFTPSSNEYDIEEVVVSESIGILNPAFSNVSITIRGTQK
jgi:phospholipid-translocating ATPase